MNKTIKPWTIYLWRNGDKMEGASPVVTRDGIKEIFRAGWEIEKVPDVKLNEDRHQEFRARVSVKGLLNNTLNVLNWYGRKVLGSNGNIETEKLRLLEAQVATQAVKENERIKRLNDHLPRGKKLKGIDMNDLYTIKKFPQKDITIQEATEYGFIGDSMNKFIDKQK